MDHLIQARRPDLVLINKKKKKRELVAYHIFTQTPLKAYLLKLLWKTYKNYKLNDGLASLKMNSINRKWFYIKLLATEGGI